MYKLILISIVLLGVIFVLSTTTISQSRFTLDDAASFPENM